MNILKILILGSVVSCSDNSAVTKSNSDQNSEDSLNDAQNLNSGHRDSLNTGGQFNVKTGCEWLGSIVKAKGTGRWNDTAAIQNCLYAAGARFASQCPARAWNATDGYPQCAPVEVQVPAGVYFVEGVWKTSYPEHGNLNNSAYVNQWVVFSMPRGVSIKGAGASKSMITLAKKGDCLLAKNTNGEAISGTNTCNGDRFAKRTGTYMFMAGFEKMERDEVIDGQTRKVGYCQQSEAIAHNKLCGASWDERRASGSQNTFSDIALLGDGDALANDWVNGMLKSQSTAIHTYRSRDIVLKNVKTDYWYRAVNVREGNGVVIENSFIYNNFKASLYFSAPYAISANTVPAQINNFNIGKLTESRRPMMISGNTITNTPAFFAKLKAKTAAPWGALNGIYFIGNANTVGCFDVDVRSNKLQYAKIYYEQPCGRVNIEGNTVSRASTPIQVGSYENTLGLNYAQEVRVVNNIIRESVSGVLIRGCLFNDSTVRCRSNNVAPLVQGNQMDGFIPLSGPGSDVWVTEMAGSQKPLGGIVVADAKNVRIENNRIANLRKGSQSYGIAIQSSRFNTQPYSSNTPGANCYTPIIRTSGIAISDNFISYSSASNTNITGIGLKKIVNGAAVGDKNVGVYISDSDNVDYSDQSGSMVNVESNRLINSSLLNTQATGFCSSSANGSSADCPRRIDSSNSLMALSCSPDVKACIWNIPGLELPDPLPPGITTLAQYNRMVFDSYYAQMCRRENANRSDEEIYFP